jgi:hypothetical protein
MLGLPAIVHMGMLVAPFGDGRNAPPANEDIGRVAAGVLSNPKSHIGKSYRPTSSELLSPQDIAGIFGKVLGRKVKYQDVSFKVFSKAAKALGFADFEISQLRHYAEALRNGAYEIGAPTDHVELITGQKPESFESISRRYLANPSLIHPKLANGGKLSALAFMLRMMLTSAPDYDRWELEQGHPQLKSPVIATASKEWLASDERQQLNLLSVQ